jgi:uncharacterized protein YxeA
MNKLLAVLVASTFAFASASTFAANTANSPQANPAVKHTVVYKANQVKKPTFHQVRHGKKHAKRHYRKARRAA